MMTKTTWLIDETSPLTEKELCNIGKQDRSAQNTYQLAVTLKDIIIHDNKKWFGEADIRLDALVITGYGQKDDPLSFYMPETVVFPRVKDGDPLPIGEGGLLIFYGTAQHFLDIRILLSRDTKDTDSLASLLKNNLKSAEVKDAMGALLELAVSSPQLATVKAGIIGASILGEFTYRVLRNACGSTIGIYCNSHRQYSDNFGIGPHPCPPASSYRAKDLSFRYDITLEEEKEEDDPYAF